MLLNRKRVNKGMKRTNSLPLSPVVLTRPYCRENHYLQVLRMRSDLRSIVLLLTRTKAFPRFSKKKFCLT